MFLPEGFLWFTHVVFIFLKQILEFLQLFCNIAFANFGTCLEFHVPGLALWFFCFEIPFLALLYLPFDDFSLLGSASSSNPLPSSGSFREYVLLDFSGKSKLINDTRMSILRMGVGTLHTTWYHPMLSICFHCVVQIFYILFLVCVCVHGWSTAIDAKGVVCKRGHHK